MKVSILFILYFETFNLFHMLSIKKHHSENLYILTQVSNYINWMSKSRVTNERIMTEMSRSAVATNP